MTLKVIATDIDGTFLKGDRSYDKERFTKLLERLTERDIRFVVASGNQYRQLRGFFPECHQKLTFIGENGANIIHRDIPLFEMFQSKEDLEDIIAFIEKEFPHAIISLSGQKKSYLKKNVPKDVFDALKPYLINLEQVASFLPLPNDSFFKMTLDVPEEETWEIMAALEKRDTGKRIVGTTSGFGCIDLISKGIHKGWALSKLLDEWGYTSDNLMVFGDGGNDLEMLSLGNYSYAMANAPQYVKEAARFEAKSNEEDGVLEAIEAYLDGH